MLGQGQHCDPAPCLAAALAAACRGPSRVRVRRGEEPDSTRVAGRRGAAWYSGQMAAWIFVGTENDRDLGFGVYESGYKSDVVGGEAPPSKEEHAAWRTRRLASDTLQWRVRDLHCEVHLALGDRVFVWVSADHQNGIVRVGRVSELRIRPNLDPYRQDINTIHQSSWVTLTLEGTDRPPRRIRRNDMLRESTLGDLAFVRNPDHLGERNCQITAAQETRLMEMWNALEKPALPGA